MEAILYMAAQRSSRRNSSYSNQNLQTRIASSPADTVILQTPKDVEDFFYRERYSEKNKEDEGNAYHSKSLHLLLSQRLFGPPKMSLTYQDRCRLFSRLGTTSKVTHLELQGTIMGQVLSGELIATAVQAPFLTTLTIHSGLILDQSMSVETLSKSLRGHSNLQHVCILNFLNHVRPTFNGKCMLDPVIKALATCPRLETLELSCLASFLEWNSSLISSNALQTLLTTSTNLKKLNLTHLGLTDVEFAVIAECVGTSSLKHVLLNGNDNTIQGLQKMIYKSCCLSSSIQTLELMSHIKMSSELLDYLEWFTSFWTTCPLRQFRATFPLSFDTKLLYQQLELCNLELLETYFGNHHHHTRTFILGKVSEKPELLFQLLKEQPELFQSTPENRGGSFWSKHAFLAITVLSWMWIFLFMSGFLGWWYIDSGGVAKDDGVSTGIPWVE